MSQNTAPHFYKRQLPKTCIRLDDTAVRMIMAFALRTHCSHVQGEALFLSSFVAGFAKGFLRLMSQFRTRMFMFRRKFDKLMCFLLAEDEPAYCGLSTLVMVLNSLSVDPGVVWKGPWRWYHENMLDCCESLAVIQSRGVTFRQFACMARCNMLDVQAVRAMPVNEAAVNAFRTAVKYVRVILKPFCDDDIVAQLDCSLTGSGCRRTICAGAYRPVATQMSASS